MGDRRRGHELVVVPAIEELADPGAVADELLGDVLTLLVDASGRRGQERPS